MDVMWIKDTDAEFDVVVQMPGTLQGDGTWNFGGFQVTSPTSQWTINSGDNVVWNPQNNSWPTVNGGGAVFQGSNAGGSPLLAFMTFHSGFNSSGPIAGMGNSAHMPPWVGQMRFWVAMPVADPNTWVCVVRYAGNSLGS